MKQLFTKSIFWLLLPVMVFSLVQVHRRHLDNLCKKDAFGVLDHNGLTLIGNLFADVGYAMADPRIRHGRA